MGRSKASVNVQPDSLNTEMNEVLDVECKSNTEDNVECSLELKRELSLIGGMSFIIGTIVGSGIFISPKGVLSSTGSVGLSLVVWVGSGLIGMLGALCYSEIGTLLPMSGGEYTYIREGYGNVLGFCCVWVSTVLLRPSSLAVMALTFGTYFSAIFPICGEPEVLVKVAAMAALVTVMVINCYSVKIAAQMQIATTVAKVVALLVIVGGGLYKIAQGSTGDLSSGFDGSTTNPTTISLAFYSALWAYDGWNNLNQVTEELKNPSVNLPRANILSMLLVIVIYGLVNVAYLTVMTRQELLDSDAVAVLWADRVLGKAAIIIPLSVMISTFGALNGTAFAGGRSVFAAARDGNLPELLAFINVKQLTPMPCMLVSCLLGMVFVFLGDISSLINFFSFTAWLFYGLIFASVVFFRYTKRDESRPYKVPIIIPILMTIVSIYLVIAPIIEEPDVGYLYAVLFVVGGVLVYIPLIHFKLPIPFIDKITMYLQLVLEVSPTLKME